MNPIVKFPSTGAAETSREYVGDLPIPFCTVGEFEAVTGVSSQSIRRYIRMGQIPAIRIGRRILIRTDKLLEEGGPDD